MGGPPAWFLALALLAVSLAIRPVPMAAPVAMGMVSVAVAPEEARWLEEGGYEAPVVPPEVDVAELRSRLGDDPESFSALVDAYAGETPRRVAEIRAAVEAEDWPRVARAAHALRGTLGLLAARACQDTVERIEAAAACADQPAALAFLEELEVRSARLAAELNALHGGPIG